VPKCNAADAQYMGKNRKAGSINNPAFYGWLHIILLLTVLFACMPKKKAHSLKERASTLDLSNRWATPLPIIAGPEALRPTLLRGLPFSQHLHFIFRLYRHKTGNL